MIITIDGPTSSGKSTIARLIAQELNYLYINSGLLFRAVAYATLHPQKDSSVPVENLFSEHILRYSFDKNAPSIFFNGTNITHLLKSPELDQAASQIALHQTIRTALLTYQRELAHEKNVVAEGRDCGTVVFPMANYKFFLTATAEIRARRWCDAQIKIGHDLSFEECLTKTKERDQRDSERKIAPLVIPSDAMIIDSSSMSIQEVTKTILNVLPSNIY